jgi:hypothetical protein
MKRYPLGSPIVNQITDHNRITEAAKPIRSSSHASDLATVREPNPLRTMASRMMLTICFLAPLQTTRFFFSPPPPSSNHSPLDAAIRQRANRTTMDFPFGVIIKAAELEARIQTANNTVDRLREDLTAKNGELQLLLKVLDSKDKLHKLEIESLYKQILESKDALREQEMDFTKQKLNFTASILILAVLVAGILFFSPPKFP